MEKNDSIISENVKNTENNFHITLKNFKNKFPFTWGIIICNINLYLIFSSVYWCSALGFPSNINLLLYIFAEIILVFDFFLKLILRRFKRITNVYQKFFKIEKKFNVLDLILQIIFNFPIISTIYWLNREKAHDHYYAFSIKLIKIWDIIQFIQNFEEILLCSSLFDIIYFKLFENILIMAAFTHFSACSWLFVNKIWPKSNCKKGYFLRKNREKLPLIDTYLDSLVWAVSAMTGASYGDVTPNTSQEIVISVMMLVIGASFYGKVFADFEKIIQINKLEKIEKKYNFILNFYRT